MLIKITEMFAQFFLLAARVALIIVLMSTVTSCSRGKQFDFEKQQAFEARFVAGMSKTEVEEELDKIGNYEFVDTWIFPNEDIGIEYRTNTSDWGSPVYYFRFSPDDALITLFPPLLR